jgi:hypothetical protein
MSAGMDWSALAVGMMNNNNQQYMNQSGTVTTKKDISQAGINKLIYDVLSSDQGLAALSGAETASGGYKSSSKSLLSQDLITKIVGEIANVTASTTQTTDMDSENVKRSAIGAKFLPGASKNSGTVICTELLNQGKLDAKLYSAGHSHFLSLSSRTIRGYQFLATPIARRMKTSVRLSNFFLPIAKARYEYIVLGKFSFLGASTIILGQPLCFLLGLCLKQPIPVVPVISVISVD